MDLCKDKDKDKDKEKDKDKDDKHVLAWIYIGPEYPGLAPLGVRAVLYSQSDTEKMENHPG